MKAMASELNMFQAQVMEYKYEIERLTRELQQLKRKYYEQVRCFMLTLCRLLIIVFSLYSLPLILQSSSHFAILPLYPLLLRTTSLSSNTSAKPLVQKRREQLARDAQRGDLADTDPLVKQQQQFHAAQPRFVGGGFALSATQ
jgi:hypothetical protein